MLPFSGRFFISQSAFHASLHTHVLFPSQVPKGYYSTEVKDPLFAEERIVLLTLNNFTLFWIFTRFGFLRDLDLEYSYIGYIRKIEFRQGCASFLKETLHFVVALRLTLVHHKLWHWLIRCKNKPLTRIKGLVLNSVVRRQQKGRSQNTLVWN